MKKKYVLTDKLRKERENLNLTYRDMAKKMGYKSPSTYMYIENGGTVPTAEMMVSIASILDKPVECFFDLKVQSSQTLRTGTDI
jgi:transcriptional regulator with XRE-family HTH domain